MSGALQTASGSSEAACGRRAVRPLVLPVWLCVVLGVATGVMGLILMRVVPSPTDLERFNRYSEWGRQWNQMELACGKHAPRDPECLKRHPVGPMPQ